MLGFQTKRGCRCILPVLTQIGVVFGVRFASETKIRLWLGLLVACHNARIKPEDTCVRYVIKLVT